MNTITFIGIWILLSFPIVRNVNKRMEELEDEIRHETSFQVFLFIRAQFEVPRFYLLNLISLLINKQK
jgi:hypothetical protein